MKKLLAIILLLVCMTASVAAAESLKLDFSSIPYEALINLHQQITKEIMSRPEWKEVTVPSGVWKVGEDIPAGKYAIKTTSSLVTITIWSKEPGDYSGFVDMKMISTTDGIGKIELKDGWTIENTSSIIFTPPQSLGF